MGAAGPGPTALQLALQRAEQGSGSGVVAASDVKPVTTSPTQLTPPSTAPAREEQQGNGGTPPSGSTPPGATPRTRSTLEAIDKVMELPVNHAADNASRDKRNTGKESAGMYRPRITIGPEKSSKGSAAQGVK